MAEDDRARLVATMRATATWRGRKADEFASDHVARRRGLRAKAAITYAVSVVQRMPVNDPDLRWLRYVDVERDRLALSEGSLDVLSRFGMDRGAWGPGVTHPSEVQVRKMLRRMSGAEAAERAAQRPSQSA